MNEAVTRPTNRYERYHAHVLRTPREVRNAIAYVLHNARRHGRIVTGIDDYSSGPWFDGWKEPVRSLRRFLVRARTWLLGSGWQRHGRIGVAETPLSAG